MGFTNGVPIKLIKRVNEIEVDSHYYDNTIIPSKQEYFEFKLIEDPNTPNQYLEAHVIGLSETGKQQLNLSIPYKYKYGDETSEMYIPVTQLYYTNDSGNIVTNIFENCTNIKHIDVPNSISIIPSACFKGCTNLESISLPSSIKTIDSNAFEGCVKLGLTYINYNVTNIGEDIFKNCGEDLAILCYKYSVIEKYCKENDIKYSLISYTLDEHVTKDSENMVTSGMTWEADNWLNTKIQNHLDDKINPHDDSTFKNSNLTGTTKVNKENVNDSIIKNLEVSNYIKISEGQLINIYELSQEEINNIKSNLKTANPDLSEEEIDGLVEEEIKNINGQALINKQYVDSNDNLLDKRITNEVDIINKSILDNVTIINNKITQTNNKFNNYSTTSQINDTYQKINDNDLETENKTVVGAINEIKNKINNIEIPTSINLTNYQKITDNNLTTTTKNVIGAINESNNKTNLINTTLIAKDENGNPYTNVVSLGKTYPINWMFTGAPYCFDEIGNSVNYVINPNDKNSSSFTIIVDKDCTLHCSTAPYNIISGTSMDLILLSYYYTLNDGKDLDTKTQMSIMDENGNDIWSTLGIDSTVGYGEETSIIKYNDNTLLSFAGDNTGTNGITGEDGITRYYESIYINLNNIQSLLNEKNITSDLYITLYGMWYDEVENGNKHINVEFDCYTENETFNLSSDLTSNNKKYNITNVTNTYSNHNMDCYITATKNGGANESSYLTTYTPAFRLIIHNTSNIEGDNHRTITLEELAKLN